MVALLPLQILCAAPVVADGSGFTVIVTEAVLVQVVDVFVTVKV